MARLSTTSRYTLDASGQTASPKTKADAVSYSLHKVVEGDTLMNISARRLGSDLRWWEIADINPQIKFPEDISLGDVLRIPR